MANPVTLIIHQIMPSSSVISAEIKCFEKFSSVLNYLDELIGKIQLYKCELKSEYYCITFTANRYPATNLGDYDITLNRMEFDLDLLINIVASLESDCQ